MHEADAIFEQALRARLQSVADDGFSKGVVASVRRRLWGRRITLFSAMAAGFAAALPFAGDAVLALSDQLTVLATQWEGAGSRGNVAAMLSAFPAREAILQFSAQLTDVAANWRDPKWFLQFGMALPAGILALLTPLAVRLLEN